MNLLYAWWLVVAVVLLGIWVVRHAVMAFADRQRLFLASRTCPHRQDKLEEVRPDWDYRPSGQCTLLTAFGTDDANEPSDAWPLVSIIVAARDEEANIQPCVESLLEQDYPRVELIVVNDRSSDRTSAIVEAIRDNHARGERLRLVQIHSLPAGWYGKHHAMKAGVESAKGSLLCFIDADCRQTSPCTLWTAVARLLSWRQPGQPIDFLTIIPRLELVSFWDRIVQPLLAAQIIAWFPPFLVNHHRTRTAYANGMFMLMRRSCYHGIGGMDAARDFANEDIRLAELTKRTGFRLHVVENEDLYVARMYRSPRDAMRGWSRIFCGALKSPWKIGVTMASWVLTVILPFVSFMTAIGGLLLGRTGWTAFVIWGTVFVMMCLGAARIYRWFSVPRKYALALPFLACFVMIVLGSAWTQAVGLVRTHWRGTAYPPSNGGLLRRRAA